jgi:hypothetical protein
MPPQLKDSSPYWRAFFAILMILQMLVTALVGVLWSDTRESRDTSRANAQWIETATPVIADNADSVRRMEKQLAVIVDRQTK